jgi:hypothetical protein
MASDVGLWRQTFTANTDFREKEALEQPEHPREV